MKRKHKSLGQIAYEACAESGQQNFGPWNSAPEIVRYVHEEMARTVARAVMNRLRRHFTVKKKAAKR